MPFPHGNIGRLHFLASKTGVEVQIIGFIIFGKSTPAICSAFEDE